MDEILDREEKHSVDVRSIREKHGLTQKQFAEELGVSPTTVSNWEQGNSQPGSDNLEKIKNLEITGDDDSGSEESNTGKDIKALRDEKGFSQSELAKQLDMSPGTISNWERGESSPGSDRVERLQNIEDSFSNEEIKHLREEQHLSKTVLAEKLGVSAGMVSNWERGHLRY